MNAVNLNTASFADEFILGIVGSCGKSTISTIVSHCYFSLEMQNLALTASEFHEKLPPEDYEKHIKNVIIEVSLDEIIEKKTNKVGFDALIFSNACKNVKNDDCWHLKRPFIALNVEAVAILNNDDGHFQDFSDVTPAKIITYGLHENANVQARNISLTLDGATFDLYEDGEFIERIFSPYFGIYNIYNILAAIAFFVSIGFSSTRIVPLIADLPPIEGKFDKFDSLNNISIIVDYARTSSSINAILASISSVCKGNIITVIGAKGDTSINERKLIGKHVCSHSKTVILTSDNPAGNDVGHIIYDMMQGTVKQNYRICINREKAIEIALKLAQPNDIILILGKGCEKVQVINAKKHYFCDKATANYLVNNLKFNT